MSGNGAAIMPLQHRIRPNSIPAMWLSRATNKIRADYLSKHDSDHSDAINGTLLRHSTGQSTFPGDLTMIRKRTIIPAVFFDKKEIFMSIELDPIQCRVLGCLVEKELATPEYYPLSLNALTNACNQKSNRAPTMQLTEAEVVEALAILRKKQLAHQSAEGVRTTKYCHNLDGRLHLEPADLAILAELLLRGPQTVGELRSRAARMCNIGDFQAVEAVLENLMERQDPLVVLMPRQPGRKEQRFIHLLAGEPDVEIPITTPEIQGMSSPGGDERLLQLENEVAALREELDELRRQWQEFKAQFD